MANKKAGRKKEEHRYATKITIEINGHVKVEEVRDFLEAIGATVKASMENNGGGD